MAVVAALVAAAGATVKVQERCGSKTTLNQQRPSSSIYSYYSAQPDRTNSTCSWSVAWRY